MTKAERYYLIDSEAQKMKERYAAAGVDTERLQDATWWALLRYFMARQEREKVPRSAKVCHE
jgi:hypothetical protein